MTNRMPRNRAFTLLVPPKSNAFLTACSRVTASEPVSSFSLSRRRASVLEQHPIGKLLPAMTAEQFAFVKADIAKRGQSDSILLLDGMVLDGWHRYQMCLELGIKPKFKRLRKGADALAEVISRNLARRQLTPGQRYGVLLRVAEQYPQVRASLNAVKAEARRRQEGGKPQRRQRSSEVIGQMAGVSHATVERVDRLRKLDPARFNDVVDGKAGLTEAIHAAAS